MKNKDISTKNRMIKGVFCLIFLLSASPLFTTLGQVGESIYVLDIGGRKAVVFPKSHKYSGAIYRLKERITPDSFLIKSVDSKIKEQYCDSYRRFAESIEADMLCDFLSFGNPDKVKKRLREMRRLRKKALKRMQNEVVPDLHNYQRQYLGYINTKGETILQITLMDMRKQTDFDIDIEYNFITYSHEWHVVTLDFNCTTGVLYWPH